MIDLSSYPNFKRDIESKQTNVYPVVIIDNDMFISTVKEVIDGNQYKDYGLKISNVKDSIDLINRKFKVSNVTLTLNNYNTDNERLSDIISQYISKYVEIYYKTQSCVGLDDCLPIYKGIFKDAKYTSKSITITLEDLAEETLHKDVPIANLGYSENVFSKEYKNRYIPITYGKVDKAPAVIYKETKNNQGRIYIIPDNVFGMNNSAVEMTELNTSNHLENNLMGEIESPLYIYKSNYFNVLLNADENDIGGDFNTQTQFGISDDSNYVYIDREFNLDMPQNPPAANILDTVRVVFPNEVKLQTPDDNNQSFFDAEGKAVILVEDTIDSIGAIIDNPNMQSSFIVDEENFMSTSAKIPDVGINYDNDELLVSEFTPYNEGGSVNYPWYPENAIVMSYAWHVAAYLYASADRFQLEDGTSAIKFVEMPTADLVKEKVQQYLDIAHSGQTLRSDSSHIFQPQTRARINPNEVSQSMVSPGTAYYNYTYDAWSFYNTPGQPGYGGGATLPHGFSTVPKFQSDLRSQYWSVYGEPEYHAHDVNEFNYSVPGGAIPITTITQHHFDYNQDYLENAEYPSAFYYFVMDMQTPSSHPDYTFQKLVQNQIDWLEPNQLYGVYVGQWSSLVMEDESWLLDTEGNTRAIFLNIFDDGSGIPYLFEMDDFPVFSPTELPFQDDESDFVYGFRYRCKWNGKSIGELNSSYGSTCINPNYYWWEGDTHDAYYPVWGHNRIKARTLCGITNGKIHSWCMYMTDMMQKDALQETIPNTSRPGVPGDGTTIKPHTIIPCNHTNYFGDNFDGCGYNHSYNQEIIDDPDDFRIGAGAEGTSGEKLMLSLPLSELAASDAYSNTTRTYAYGKIKCNFNPNGVISESSQTNSDNYFQVLVSGTEIQPPTESEAGQDQTLNFSLVDPLFMTAIIDIQGGDSLNTTGQSTIFSSISQETDNQFNWDDGANYRIGEWTEPDAFNSIALTYSLTGSNDKIVALDSSITALGIMQFIAFENALNSNFYLDVYGRANTTNEEDVLGGYYKYTNELVMGGNSKVLIENPADIMYHLVEKELGQLDITSRDSWIKGRLESNGISLAFSVKEKINSKELFEEISKNCNLIPVFKQDGNFGFSTINKSYSHADVNIKTSDIIEFKIGHSPLSQVYTMVNVKYKKDYELEEYSKQTGYCDGYDFFGNGDDGYPNGYSYDTFGLNRTDNILEFESDYIRDKTSAKNLRDFLYLYHCNRHTIINCTLPMRYSNIEVGDVISFDKIIDNVKSFGEDYDVYSYNIRNGQYIYPLFIVNSVIKSPKSIKIETTQLHRLERTFTAGLGSLSRMSSDGIFSPSSLNLNDYNILYDIILEEESDNQKYITSEQKKNADINCTGVISLNDLNSLGHLLGLQNVLPGEETDSPELGQLGDINQDGFINVADVVALVQFILGGETEGLEFADVNEDGSIDVQDAVIIIEQILSGAG
tara:strand:- start:2917 stop:7278 length:4362 start_codon:yes stop_codon:yes gene_type:complete